MAYSKIVISRCLKSYQCLSTRRVPGKSLSFLPLFFDYTSSPLSDLNSSISIIWPKCHWRRWLFRRSCLSCLDRARLRRIAPPWTNWYVRDSPSHKFTILTPILLTTMWQDYRSLRRSTHSSYFDDTLSSRLRRLWQFWLIWCSSFNSFSLNNPAFFPFFVSTMPTISATSSMTGPVDAFFDSFVGFCQGSNKINWDWFVSTYEDRRK